MSIIEKLNKLDINDLQKINYSKILEIFKKRPDVLILTVAVIGGIFISGKIYAGSQQQMKSARTQIKELEKKITAIDNYKKNHTELKEFIARIPEPIDEDRLMNLITDFAVKRQVQIESFSPSPKKKAPLYETVGLSLNMSAENYKDLWLFIHDIEKSVYPLHIEKWRATPSTGQKGENKIGIQLEIVSVNLKKDE